jgi:hypothetical protein
MKKTIAILSFIFVAGTLTNAQDSIIKHSPNGVFDKVFDRYGKGYKLEELRVNTVVLDPETNTPKLLQLCSPGYFNLFFEIGSGMEGNSPTEIARRNVLCQVFSDISQFIVPVNPSTKVNILVGNINKDLPGYGVNGNMTPASSSPVLGLATGFYVVPNYSPSVKGIIDNEIWKTINSGTDSYTNVASPLYSTDPSGAQFFHGKVCINFDNSTMDWHTDLTQTTFPNYYDLYSVVLHELTHALGFASLINANGDSKLGTAYTYYTRYDQFLKSPTNLPLITNSGGCSMYQFGFNPSLSTNILAPSSSSCASAVVYDGSVTQLTYTPNVFADESSLSHFEDSCHAPVPQPDDEYYVMSNGGGTGPTYMKRYLKPEERNVLCDIGYKVNTTYGNAINLNNYNYGGSICPGNGVVGINDGLTGAMYTYMVNTTNSIPITNILANDYNAISFECLEPVYGLGTVSNSAGTSTVFTAGVAPGVELLRYVPVSTSGARGNITYVLIYVMSANCTPTACSLLNNNGFESSTTCGQLDYSPPLVATDCWLPFTNTPDIFQRNCTNSIFNWNNQFSIPALYFNNPGSDSWSGVPNNNFIGINSMVSSNGDRTTESFQSLLNVPLVSGQTYQLTFRAKVAYNSPMYYPPLGKNGQITFGASPSTLAAFNSSFNSLPAIVTPLGVPITITNHADYVMNSSNTWDLYSQTFTYSGASNYMNFIFFNTSNLNTPIPSTNEYLYIYVDDIELIALDPVNFLTIPNTLCINSLLTDLAVYAPVPNGVFSGPGVQNNSGTFSFDATLAGIGNHVIAYTFTNNNNCSVTIFDTVTVNPLPTVTVAPANSTICAGQQVTLTASGANTYTWSPVTGLSATTGTTVIASPASTTTYTIIGTNTTTGCSNTQTITVTVNPLPVVTVAPANSTICAGQQVTLTASGANTYTWSPSTGLSATTGASVTATPNSTITYTVTGSSSGCTATQTASITVNPCTDCGTGTLIAGNVGSSPAANTTLRIPNNITITGNVNFIGNNVKIHPGVTITVASTATLNITGAHFYGCENMWNGIQVQPGGKVNLQPYIVGGTVQKTTLIEDAEIAIDFLPITAQQASAFLQVNNATFNRNTTSIRVQSYAFANVGSMIVVKNSLFTCRNIYNTANSTWPLTTVVKAANGSTNPYANPYIPSTYSVLTSMKVPRTNTFSNIGIHLQNVGTTVATNPTTYNNVIIGSTVTGEYNVFDNLKTAIYCYNTNLNLVNVTMQFPQTITFAMNSQQTAPNIGTGVFAESDILHKCAVSIASATYINKFYNLNCALYTDNYYNVTFYKNAVRSLRTSSYNLYSYYNGKTGVYMNAKEFENVNISNNSIYNIDKAIWFNFNHVVPSTTVTFNVNDNNILRNLGTSATGAFGADAIYVANALSASSYNGTINVKNNIIDGYTRGLTFLNWHKTTINAQDNNITLGIDPNSFYGTPSYGIAVNNCVSTGAPKNKITGNTVLGFSQQVDSYKGISFVQSLGNDLQCNSVKNTHTGLYFNGLCNVSTYKNTMENHRYGFVLDNNGIIGQQGSPTTPADNRWLGTNWSATGTPNGNFKNACLNGSLTVNSPMYTRSAANYTPHGSVFNQTITDWAYSQSVTPITLFHISASMFSPCPISATPLPIPFSSATNSGTLLPQETVELVSSGTEEQQIVAQNQVYRIQNPANSVNTLGSLSVLQNNSNIGTLWNVEKALLAGDLIVAAQENASVQAQNTLEVAYTHYYRLFLKHKNNTFTNADSLDLVNLAEACPSVVGAVVYQAAVLYNLIYKTAEVFTNTCSTLKGRGTQDENNNNHIESVENYYKLYPVPNNGSFYLAGRITKGDRLSILSAAGKTVFETELDNSGHQLLINSKLNSGIYFVLIRSKEGVEQFKSKIVIIE